MNDHMHKLLSNKSRLRSMVRDLESESGSSEEENEAEQESPRGTEALAQEVVPA
jgi:hypothetical protein